MTKRTYTAHPEFIGRHVTLKDGSNTDEMYDLEFRLHEATRAVVEWRVKHLDEEEWGEALPQTLRTLLEGWDSTASKVAAQSYLSGKEEVIES